MIDRINGPTLVNGFDLQIPKLEEYKLQNGLAIKLLNTTDQPIVRLDLCMRAGRIYERVKAASRASFSLLKEGTPNHTAHQLAEHFDFYGAEIGHSGDLDTGRVSMTTLTKHFKAVFPLWIEMIESAIYPEVELENYKSIYSQRLALQLAKNDVISYRVFTEKMFGSNHPYGYNTMPDDIRKLDQKSLLQFNEEAMILDGSALFLSGEITDEIKQLVQDKMEKLPKGNQQAYEGQLEIESESGVYKIDEGQEAQIALKLGRRLFKRDHEDFPAMFVLNTILGGYFGSRLSSNIREDKGYCYNIYSSLDAMVNDGYWYISADIGNEYLEQTRTEIYNELRTLRTELIPKEELQMVKNYLQGHFMGMMDGPFASSRVFQGAWKFNLGPNFVKDFAKIVDQITAEELQFYAQKYLTKEEILEVYVGRGMQGI